MCSVVRLPRLAPLGRFGLKRAEAAKKDQTSNKQTDSVITNTLSSARSSSARYSAFCGRPRARGSGLFIIKPLYSTAIIAIALATRHIKSLLDRRLVWAPTAVLPPAAQPAQDRSQICTFTMSRRFPFSVVSVGLLWNAASNASTPIWGTRHEQTNGHTQQHGKNAGPHANTSNHHSAQCSRQTVALGAMHLRPPQAGCA